MGPAMRSFSAFVSPQLLSAAIPSEGFAIDQLRSAYRSLKFPWTARKVGRIGALLCAALVTFSCQIGQAQMPSDRISQDETAHLSILIPRDEAVHISLRYGSVKYVAPDTFYKSMNELGLQPSPEGALTAAIKSGFNCKEGEFESSSEYDLSIMADCPAIEQKDRQWRDQFDLLPLLTVLKSLEIEHLDVILNLPNIGSMEVLPAGESPLSDFESGEGWMQWFAPSYLAYDIDTANPQITKITYRYGFTANQIILRAGILAIVLLLPVIAVWWMRSRTLRIHAQGIHTHLWFGYQRSLAWIETGFWIIWTAAFFGLAALDWLPMLLSKASDGAWQSAAIPFLIVVPPMLIGALNRGLSYRVTKEIGESDYKLSEILAQYALGQGVVLFPFVMVLLAPFLFEQHLWSNAIAVLAFVGLLLSLSSLRKLNDWTPYAITTGELRDRIFELAKPTGVEIKQIYLLPMKRSRMVNAFAVSNHTVMVTDYLLKQLSKAEVDAVMAHELAHLQLGHPRQLRIRLFGLFFLSFWILPLSLSFLYWLLPLPLAMQLPLMIVIISGVFYATSRKFEYQADAQASLITGDPQSMMTGLIKIARLSQMPLQWSKLSESMMTHPSMQRRVEAIAKRYDLSIDQLETWIATSENAERYCVNDLLSPQGVTPKTASNAAKKVASDVADSPPSEISDRELSAKQIDGQTDSEFDSQSLLFSTQFKQRSLSRIGWLIILCFTLVPVVLGRLVQLLPTAGLQWLGYGGSALFIVSFYYLIQNFAPVYGYQSLDNQISQRLRTEGFEPSEGRFVGFAPGVELKNYEGHTNWDVGRLFLVGDRLCYIGERLRFALTTTQITQVTIITELTGLIDSPIIAVTWQGEDLASHRFRLQTIEAKSLRQVHPLTQTLRTDLETWKETDHSSYIAASQLPLFEALQPPALGEVTSLPLIALSFSAVFSAWLSFVIIGLIIAALTGSLFITPSLTRFILIMATIGAALQFIPALRRLSAEQLKRKK